MEFPLNKVRTGSKSEIPWSASFVSGILRIGEARGIDDARSSAAGTRPHVDALNRPGNGLVIRLRREMAGARRHAWPPEGPAVLALGPLVITNQGDTGHIGGPKQQLVLALLLEAAGSSVGVDRLIDGVWDADPPASARGTLQSYLSNIRASLGDIIVREGAAYRIDVTPGNFDVLRFESLVESARTAVEADPAGGVASYRSALSLWRGEPYAGLDSCPTLHSEVVRLEELKVAALEDCLDAELRLGRHSTLVAELEQLVSTHPFRERLISQLVLALYRSGRRVDALSVLQDARVAFLDEFGLSPSLNLQRLEELVLKQSQSLDLPSSPAT